MTGWVVKDHNISFVQTWRKLRLNVGLKHGTVHCAIDDPWRIQPVLAQRRDKGLRAPVPKRCVIHEPLFWHVRFQSSFLDEHNAFEHVSHKGLAMSDPEMFFAGNVGPLLFKRLHIFFCVSVLGGPTAAQSMSYAREVASPRRSG